MSIENETYQTERQILTKDIINTLAYFDVFNHPLTEGEIANLSGMSITEGLLFSVLSDLVEEEIIAERESYYSLSDYISEQIKERKSKEGEAEKYWKKGRKYANLIQQFPFVKGVAISGSLSKGVMSEDGDVDYFIITEPNRLWLARTLLILFKKTVLLNSRKYFCVNYFVDTKHLEILDKNIFTATEIAFVVPMTSQETYTDFKKANSWINKFYPHFTHPIQMNPRTKRTRFKKFMEYLFKGRIGEKLDLYFMKITLRKWEKKFDHFTPSKFELTLRSQRGISKHHPRDFQNKVLEEWEIRRTKTLKKLNL